MSAISSYNSYWNHQHPQCVVVTTEEALCKRNAEVKKNSELCMKEHGQDPDRLVDSRWELMPHYWSVL